MMPKHDSTIPPVVLVTWAVRNTGRAIAEAFAREGAHIVLNGRRESDVVREAERLRRDHGVPVLEAVGDISRQDEVDRIFALVEKDAGRLDVLVNNAAALGIGHELIDTPRELLEAVFQVNVFGLFACSQAAARIMRRQGLGAIVNVGSHTALRAIKNRSAYIASKGAAEALNRAMATELGPLGIRVNSVVAGYIHTDRWEDLSTEDTARRRQNTPWEKKRPAAILPPPYFFSRRTRPSRSMARNWSSTGG